MYSAWSIDFTWFFPRSVPDPATHNGTSGYFQSVKTVTLPVIRASNIPVFAPALHSTVQTIPVCCCFPYITAPCSRAVKRTTIRAKPHAVMLISVPIVSITCLSVYGPRVKENRLGRVSTIQGEQGR
ncbi:hypothetical protein, unlikely [Trypanosoma brucei gambiense DAL972]|uniref:Uncharacterized protein n=1 Tax=Trypanosoma brucei gambiense (strain MHOM/CI/86/DAL972) TaxID=679716 RepID=C9ZQ43_TRYB9|nr:hypothetical protein, unlikely [Trypanosoma brucei gambiense DAL972]CBH11522.1 hypothetical protein, unlikely [Trypanosoma brucei gambiense DAL972]|eukprot:XP_011773808.1 hypothetical protein, unlikely [Trypanosoma brucei gambiense DAL972]